MDVIYEDFPESVELIFYVVASDIKVRFKCRDIEFYSLEKNWNEGALFVVLEASVKPPLVQFNADSYRDSHISSDQLKQHMWKILVQPGACLNIKCLQFNWVLEELTNEEKSWFKST